MVPSPAGSRRGSVVVPLEVAMSLAGEGSDGEPTDASREAKLRRQVTKARRRFYALGFPETAPLTVAFARFVAAALELLPSGDSDTAADADSADVMIGFSARQQRERDNTADVRQRLHGGNWKQLIVEFAMERCAAAVNDEADVTTADHLASGLKAIYYADKPAFLALLRRTTPKLQPTHSDADGAEAEEPACDLGLLAHLVLTSKPIMRDASVRKAIIALITAHIKSVIAADVDGPEPAWHDFVQVVRSVVCVLQCDGRPSRSVVAAATSSSSATSSTTRPAGTSPNGSSASLLTSSSAALLAHVASLSEAVASGPYFKIMVANILPPQLVQPFVDAAFKKRGLNPEDFWRSAGLPEAQWPDPNGTRFANGAPPPAPPKLEGTPEHPGPAVPPGSPCSYTPGAGADPSPADPLPCSHLSVGPFGGPDYAPPNVVSSAPNPAGVPTGPGVPSAAFPGQPAENVPGTPVPLPPAPVGARTVPLTPQPGDSDIAPGFAPIPGPLIAPPAPPGPGPSAGPAGTAPLPGNPPFLPPGSQG